MLPLVMLLVAGLARPVTGEDWVGLESSWSALQGWGEGRALTGVEGATALSGWTNPGLWLALVGGLDLTTDGSGSFAGLRPHADLRGGVLLPIADVAVFLPWAGVSATSLWQAQGGLEAEMRLWKTQSLTGGVSIRGGSFVVSLGLRDRHRWTLPPPPLPQVSLALGPELFSPDDDGYGDQLKVNVQVAPGGRLSRWSWTVWAPGSQLFFHQQGQGRPPSEIIWNGRSEGGELVSSATDYRFVIEGEDERGRVVEASVDFTTDVLLLKDNDRYLVRLPSINFSPNSPGIGPGAGDRPDRLQATLLEQNAAVIGRLADILKRYPQYGITIVGHANLVHWENPAMAAEEDRKESRPLSLKRALAVKEALVALGLEANRIKTEGAGGSRPLFPFGDRANAWKNRRVDVILDRKAASAPTL